MTKMNRTNGELKAALNGDIDITFFYYKDNPTSYIFEVTELLHFEVWNSRYNEKIVESTMEFAGYTKMIEMFTSCLTPMEKLYPERINMERMLEVSNISNVPLDFIEKHIQFFLKARSYIRESIRTKGKIKSVREYKKRMDAFVQTSGF